ncbi:MAG: antibiotic biosynthesis monooxygenase [Bacteroidota bacterium]
MILEVAILYIKQGQSNAFEKAFQEAAPFIQNNPGYISHELRKCMESEDKYLLLVNWESLEAHEEGFRKSDNYGPWKKLLHHFYEPFPLVEHYEVV